MPERIQLSRKKGWRKPENTVVVARPSKWGNPFAVGHGYSIIDATGVIVDLTGRYPVYIPDSGVAVAFYRDWMADQIRIVGLHRRPALAEIRTALAGKNLACWCPLSLPCHADVLLEIANRDA